MGVYADRGYDVETARMVCGGEIETWYGNKTLDVFDSAATGIKRRYYCSESEQLRMVNGRVSNTSMELMCGVPDASNEVSVFDWLTHSASECGKVHTDYVQFVKAIASKYQSLKVQLAAATTVLEVDAVFEQLV